MKKYILCVGFDSDCMSETYYCKDLDTAMDLREHITLVALSSNEIRAIFNCIKKWSEVMQKWETVAVLKLMKPRG